MTSAWASENRTETETETRTEKISADGMKKEASGSVLDRPGLMRKNVIKSSLVDAWNATILTTN